jgi:hypothetical protein
LQISCYEWNSIETHIRLKACDDGTLVQIFCCWTLSVILSLSKNTVLLIFQNTTFRRLDSVSVFRLNLLSWAQSIELVPISGPFSKHNVSETGFCLRLQAKPTHLGPIDRAGPYLQIFFQRQCVGDWILSPSSGSSIDWAQLNRFYLKTETECSLRNVMF